MARDRKLEERLAELDEDAESSKAAAWRLAGEGEDGKAIVAGLEAVAVELRALRLAVLSREPVRWWW